MQNKTVHIMDPLEPLPDNACLKGYHQEMAYIPTFHTNARMFNLAMALSNSRWSKNIYYWERKYPKYVTKVLGHKYW